MTEHCEVYEYQHLNTSVDAQGGSCPYCQPTMQAELVTESATAYTLLVQPTTPTVCALIIPKRHITDYFALSHHEKTACWLMVDRIQALFKQLFQPEGYQVSTAVANLNHQHAPHAVIELKLHSCQVDGTS